MPNSIRTVINRILTRYNAPGRANFCTLFLLRADADFDALIPTIAHCLAAWADYGDGMHTVSVDQAVAALQADRDPELAARDRKEIEDPQTRRRQMTRVIGFTVYHTAPDEIQLDLTSRALHYSPKGDRTAHEVWRPGDDGGWYSLYVPRDESEV